MRFEIGEAMDRMRLTIDGKQVQGPRGATVLDIARESGIHIPTLCAHEDLPNFGACRLCVVEIDGIRGYPTSCTTPAAEGMVVRTQSADLEEIRSTVMELMLSGHPNSCLVCNDRDECQKYRPKPTKSGRATRCGFCSNSPTCAIRKMSNEGAPPVLNLPTIYSQHKVERDDPFIERDHNMCVLCGRCWRICEQIHGTPAISIVQRGRDAKISAAFGRSWLDSGCTFCGACIDICPTATITDRYSRWYSNPREAAETTCTLCSEGCSVTPVVSEGSVVETKMTTFQRESRLCALGRFAYAQLMNAPRRLDRPLIREDGDLTPVPWDEAIEVVAAEMKKRILPSLDSSSPAENGDLRAAVIVGELHTREDRFLYEQLAAAIGGQVAVAGDSPSGQVWDDIRGGRIKTAVVCGDYLDAAALKSIEYLVVIDFLPSAASERADAVFPASILGEVEGTFRTCSGSVKPLRQVASPPGEARPEWQVVRDLCHAMGAEGFDWSIPSDLSPCLRDDAAPSRPSGSPRDSIKELPSFFRGHLIADSVVALQSMGLPCTPLPPAEEIIGGFLVVEKEEIVPNFHRLVIEAPAVAKHAKPGQFAIAMVRESSERSPFTLIDWNADQGTITLIVEEVGRSSGEIASLKAGDRLAHVSGPLGLPLPVQKVGTVVLGGGCFGVGGIYPIARAMKEAGNRVVVVLEACNNLMFYMEDELRAVCDEMILVTKDGSLGRKGGVQDVFAEMARGGPPVDQFVAIGCAFMMRMTSERTRGLGVPLQVALNPIMVDGTGMCGACRVAVGGETKFACVDGPFFDGHQVDWEGLFSRRGAYHRAEVQAIPQTGAKVAIKTPLISLEALGVV